MGWSLFKKSPKEEQQKNIETPLLTERAVQEEQRKPELSREEITAACEIPSQSEGGFSFFAKIAGFFKSSNHIEKEEKRPEQGLFGSNITREFIENTRGRNVEGQDHDQSNTFLKQRLKIDFQPSEAADEKDESFDIDLSEMQVHETKTDNQLNHSNIGDFFSNLWFNTKVLFLGEATRELDDFRFMNILEMKKPTATVKRNGHIIITPEAMNLNLFGIKEEMPGVLELDYDRKNDQLSGNLKKGQFEFKWHGLTLTIKDMEYISSTNDFAVNSASINIEVGDSLKGGIEEFSFHINENGITNTNIESMGIEVINFIDLTLKKPKLDNNGLTAEEVSFTVKNDIEENKDGEQENFLGKHADLFKYIGFEGFGIKIEKLSYTKNQGFKIEKIGFVCGEVALHIFNVVGKLNIPEKQGSIGIEDWEFPGETAFWPIKAELDVPVASVPISIYGGVEIGGGVKVAGNAGIKKGEGQDKDWDAVGRAGIQGELNARIGAGVKLGSDWILSASAGLFAEAGIHASAIGNIGTTFYIQNKKIQSKKEGFNFKYNIESKVVAAVGAEVKASALKVFHKKLYEIRFKEWELGLFMMKGEVTRDKKGKFHHEKASDNIWQLKKNTKPVEADTTSKEGEDAKRALLEAGQVYGSTGERTNLAQDAKGIGQKFEASLKVSIRNIKKYQKKADTYSLRIQQAQKHIQKHKNRLARHDEVRKSMLDLENEKSLERIFSKHAIAEVKKNFDSTKTLGEQLKAYSERRRDKKSSRKGKNKHEGRIARYEEAKKGNVSLTEEHLAGIYETEGGFKHFLNHVIPFLNLDSSAVRTAKGMHKKNQEKSMEEHIREYTENRIGSYEEKMKSIGEKQQTYEVMENNALREAAMAQKVLEDIEKAIKSPKELEKGLDSYMAVIRKEYLHGEERNKQKEEMVKEQEQKLERIDKTIQEEVKKIESLVEEESKEKGKK
ncbi:hypothetical protein [Crassaminicella profunda]|uniref:hypothetical protein n=1 Tax=Crassaminicella profunda TaxID=1286698 RepID=UPI001CA6DE06|nr:hypothetical protein [Crassaminicella profunda]QZY54481.1 hypothetical protein K7H06_15765 [Crassaminicella profunda]